MFTFIYDYNCAKIIAIDNDLTEYTVNITTFLWLTV